MATRALPVGFSRRARALSERWLGADYNAMRERRGLTCHEALILSRKRLAAAVKAGVKPRDVSDWRLDNPYMAQHAWKLMLGCALREVQKAKEWNLRRVA